ncbi:MAG: glycosyltransferase [Rothia sp.]|uniref:glycosyltransferase n=1 Tax=Rothia sp. (in: high G+C Gram-positive bacteria) TaxID=1885016 RepID=UPI001CAFD377|nr:glycosyltransferase [Rothia sp. (in: high G+C Gram-positive bacteria)]MBF1680538.1 glycosyltransferase [Rothia sp. (in: high G+C Gram-positive bacteria)]
MAATLPDPNYQPTYRSNGVCDDLAALVAPYSLSRAQLAEATGIADEAIVNSWVAQCYPDLAADAPAPLEPVLRYLDETYLPDSANWPGDNPYDEFVLENIAARMLARVVADTFGEDRPGNYRELLALIATLVLIARYWDGTDEAFLTLLNAEPTAEAEESLQEAIANAPESLHPLLTELLLPALYEARGTFTADEAQLLTGYALAAGYYAGEHPYETLNGIHVAFAADDRTQPDAEQIRRVEDVLKANFQAARAAADADENPEPHHFTLPGNQDGYETAAHLIAALPQAHDVIAFSTQPGEGTSALADDRRAAFTLYLCYLMLGDDESSEQCAAELYRASREN